MSEMTTIRATCPRCGEVEMGAQAILLSVREADGEGSYAFTCPVCDDTVEKPADRKVVMLLLSAGVDVSRVQDDAPTEPAETTEAEVWAAVESRPDGPPLTADDLIDFHFLLEREDWFAQLATAH